MLIDSRKMARINESNTIAFTVLAREQVKNGYADSENTTEIDKSLIDIAAKAVYEKMEKMIAKGYNVADVTDTSFYKETVSDAIHRAYHTGKYSAFSARQE